MFWISYLHFHILRNYENIHNFRPLIFLSFLAVSANASRKIFKRSGDSANCFFLNFSGNASSFFFILNDVLCVFLIDSLYYVEFCCLLFSHTLGLL